MNTKENSIFTKKIFIVLLALICCALWGSAFPCVKIGYKMLSITTTGSQILFAGYRFFLAGIMTLMAASIMERRVVTIKKTSFPYIFGQGVIQTTAQYICFYIGMAHTTGSKGSVINASNAFFAIITAHFLLKDEKISLRKMAGCIIGFMGVIVVNLQPGAWSSGFSLNGEGMILLCSAVYGASSVTLKIISHRENTTTITAYQLLFGGLMLIFAGIITGGSVHGFTVSSVILLLYMALLSTIAFSIWTALLKYNPIGKIAVFGFTIPIFGVAFSAVFLNENAFSVQNFAALVLVSIGIIVVNSTKMSIKKPECKY